MATTESVTEIADYENDTEASPSQKADDDLAAMKKRVAAIEAEAAKITSMTTLDGTPPSTKATSTESSPHESESAVKEDDVKAPKEGAEENWPRTIEEQKELDQRSVYVNNVDPMADANELKAHFESCGTIERITIVCDKWTGQPKERAYIQFKAKESVAAACLLDQKEFKGRAITVQVKRTNLPHWMRGEGGRGGRGRGRGRGRGYRGRGGYRGYRGRGGWRGYGGYRGRGGGWGGYGGYGYGGYPY